MSSVGDKKALQHAAMIVVKYRFLLTLGLFLLSFRGCAWFNGKYVAFVILNLRTSLNFISLVISAVTVQE